MIRELGNHSPLLPAIPIPPSHNHQQAFGAQDIDGIPNANIATEPKKGGRVVLHSTSQAFRSLTAFVNFHAREIGKYVTQPREACLFQHHMPKMIPFAGITFFVFYCQTDWLRRIVFRVPVEDSSAREDCRVLVRGVAMAA